MFRGLKDKWRDTLESYRTENPIGNINKAEFPPLLKEAFEKLEPASLVNSFEAAGIYPLDKQKVIKRIPNQKVFHFPLSLQEVVKLFGFNTVRSNQMRRLFCLLLPWQYPPHLIDLSVRNTAKYPEWKNVCIQFYSVLSLTEAIWGFFARLEMSRKRISLLVILRKSTKEYIKLLLEIKADKSFDSNICLSNLIFPSSEIG